MTDVDSLGAVALPDTEGAHELIFTDGRIAAIRPVAGTPTRLALPAFADLHLHADRAFARGPRPPRSLADAIQLVREIKLATTEADVRGRAARLFARALEHGSLRLRTHVDVDELVGERALRGVLAARAAVADTLEIEIVAFATSTCDPATADGEAKLRAAVAEGADLLGGVPAFHADPVSSIDRILGLAAQLDRRVDVHVDEASTPDGFTLETLADLTVAHGLEGRVAASHACALAVVDTATAQRTIDKIAAARITVIALPAVNLYLQGRGQGTPRVRGVTLVRELLAAGVPVRFGSDNVSDVFYRYGDADPLETAWLAAVAAHLDDENAVLAGVCDGRSRLAVGDPADLVVVDAPSVADALARRPGGRTVIRAGRIVARG
jgi:cytosine/creatinine deaminase